MSEVLAEEWGVLYSTHIDNVAMWYFTEQIARMVWAERRTGAIALIMRHVTPWEVVDE